ncbi:hypothetical protein Tco_0887978 [Tanacetum coccineum]
MIRILAGQIGRFAAMAVMMILLLKVKETLITDHEDIHYFRAEVTGYSENDISMEKDRFVVVDREKSDDSGALEKELNINGGGVSRILGVEAGAELEIVVKWNVAQLRENHSSNGETVDEHPIVSHPEPPSASSGFSTNDVTVSTLISKIKEAQNQKQVLETTF